MLSGAERFFGPLRAARVILGVIALTPCRAMAQHGLDRALTGKRGEAPEPRRAVPATPAAVESLKVLEAKWLVQPLGSTATNYKDVGVLAGYQNTNRFTAIPWQFDMRGSARWIAGSAHFHWQADAEVDPPIGDGPLLAVLTAQHGVTRAVGRSDEVTAEVDVAIVRDPSITLGAVGYYDWNEPENAPATDGATPGLTGSWSRPSGRLTLLGEYDFSSTFAGSDNYAIAGSYLVSGTSGSTQISIRGGWVKGNAVSLSLQIGVPSVKQSTRLRTNR